MRSQRYCGYGDSTFEKLIVVAVIGVVAILGLFFGLVESPAQFAKSLSGQQGSTPAVPVNNKNSAVSASSVLFLYSLNSSQANAQYSGKLAYLSGIVGNVEPAPDGAYQSCIESDSIGGYLIDGCAQTGGGGWIIWQWNARTNSSSVPIDANFIAECTVQGVSGANLILQSCDLIH